MAFGRDGRRILAGIGKVFTGERSALSETIRKVEDGEVIFTRDEPSDFACVIETGFIEIFTEANGAEDTIAVLGPGELFGEMGVLDGKPRSATARARGPGRIREYEAREFVNKVRGDAQFASAIMGTLVTRLRRETTGDREERGPAIIVPMEAGPDANAAGVPEDPPGMRSTAAPERSGPQQASRAEAIDAKTFGDLPRDLVPPTIGDDSGVHAAALEAFLEGATGFAAISLPDPAISDPACPEPERAERARQALIEAKAGVVLLSRVPSDETPEWIELSVITEWPDDESRVGGFSALDTFAVPVAPEDSAIAFLRAVVTAAVPGDREETKDELSEHLAPSLDEALFSNALGRDALSPALGARQLIAYGNASARLATFETSSLRLYDAADAYRAAYDALPRDDRLGRGLARLHLAVTLNAASNRDQRPQDRERARVAAVEATELLHPDHHVYPYLTANARLGAILYRQALESQSLTLCKDGIDAFNRALAVCDKNGMPEPWADTMNGLGQLLILLGRLSRNTEFLTWAVQVCRNAMEVRNPDSNPVGWARTLNNQATALFLLGRALGDRDKLSEAVDGFERAGQAFTENAVDGLAEAAYRNLNMAKARLLGRGIAMDENW